MSQYTCRIYRNSGFNAVNIPDSPALLDTIGNYVDCYALDLNQERFLPIVKIRGDWASVKDTDYCKVGDFFYFVDDVQMLAGDVAQLTLTPDFITSAGGPAALDILDGVTDRVHVTDDTFGLYGADDPYMAPALDMDVRSYTKSFLSNGSYTFVETTLDLSTMSTYGTGSVEYPAISAVDPDHTDADGNHPYVVVPNVKYTEFSTSYYCGVGGVSVPLTHAMGQVVYELDDTSSSEPYKKAIAYARALGIDEAISGMYDIPQDLVTGGNVGSPGRKSSMRGVSTYYACDIPFVYGTANNKRMFYGRYSPYTLSAASGSSITVNAEEIYSSGLTYPQICVAVDPRRTGKPYYRFRYMNGVDGDSNMDFFRGCVSGKEWLNHPFVLKNKSGGILDILNYNNSRYMADMDARHTARNFKDASLESGIALLANAGGDLLNGQPGSAISTAVNAGIGQYERNVSIQQYSEKYAAQKAMDMQQLQISQNVNVPDVKFPVSPDLFAEATGNGFQVHRVVYKQADITRIDKILTAYGYKYAKVLEATDFSNRTYFNYVSGSITVGSLPRWWADGISAQIGTGVRVWHVKPNHTYYSSNPVRV